MAVVPFISATHLPEPEASRPPSATGQQGSHQDIAPQVALRLGQQTGSNALVQTFDGLEFALRLVESRPHYRLGEGAQEAGVGPGVSRHITAAPELDEKGYRDLQRLGAIDRNASRTGESSPSRGA